MSARSVRTGAGLMLAAMLSACAGQAFEYRSHNEIPAGPGLMTGEEGAFVIHVPGRRAAGGPVAVPRADAAAAGTAAEDELGELDAYRAYLRAKSERSEEYREFLEWREWRRYLEWKRNRDTQAGQGGQTFDRR